MVGIYKKSGRDAIRSDGPFRQGIKTIIGDVVVVEVGTKSELINCFINNKAFYSDLMIYGYKSGRAVDLTDEQEQYFLTRYATDKNYRKEEYGIEENY